jgi:hypothetical protein
MGTPCRKGGRGGQRRIKSLSKILVCNLCGTGHPETPALLGFGLKALYLFFDDGLPISSILLSCIGVDGVVF